MEIKETTQKMYNVTLTEKEIREVIAHPQALAKQLSVAIGMKNVCPVCGKDGFTRAQSYGSHLAAHKRASGELPPRRRMKRHYHRHQTSDLVPSTPSI